MIEQVTAAKYQLAALNLAINSGTLLLYSLTLPWLLLLGD